MPNNCPFYFIASVLGGAVAAIIQFPPIKTALRSKFPIPWKGNLDRSVIFICGNGIIPETALENATQYREEVTRTSQT